MATNQLGSKFGITMQMHTLWILQISIECSMVMLACARVCVRVGKCCSRVVVINKTDICRVVLRIHQYKRMDEPNDSYPLVTVLWSNIVYAGILYTPHSVKKESYEHQQYAVAIKSKRVRQSKKKNIENECNEWIKYIFVVLCFWLCWFCFGSFQSQYVCVRFWEQLYGWVCNKQQCVCSRILYIPFSTTS